MDSRHQRWFLYFTRDEEMFRAHRVSPLLTLQKTMRRRASSLVFCRLSHQTHQTDGRVGERVAERRKDVSSASSLVFFRFSFFSLFRHFFVTLHFGIFESETYFWRLRVYIFYRFPLNTITLKKVERERNSRAVSLQKGTNQPATRMSLNRSQRSCRSTKYGTQAKT